MGPFYWTMYSGEARPNDHELRFVAAVNTVHLSFTLNANKSVVTVLYILNARIYYNRHSERTVCMQTSHGLNDILRQLQITNIMQASVTSTRPALPRTTMGSSKIVNDALSPVTVSPLHNLHFSGGGNVISHSPAPVTCLYKTRKPSCR